MKDFVIRSVAKTAPMFALEAFAASPFMLPYYHTVSDEKLLHIRHLYSYKNIRQFIDDIDFLLKRYRPINLNDLLTSMRSSNVSLHGGFLLTFDDGLSEVYDNIAPVLIRKGISAVFFVNTGFIDNIALCYEHKASLILSALEGPVSKPIENAIKSVYSNSDEDCLEIRTTIKETKHDRSGLLDQIAEIMGIDFDEYLAKQKPYLTESQIKELLKKGFFIGAHSISHPRYMQLSDEEQLRQTMVSVNEVRERFGIEYGVFSFPHSDLGIKAKLLSAIHGSEIVDATFGNQGMLREAIPYHYQRFSMEKPFGSAKEIVKKNYLKAIFRNITGKGVVRRPL